MNSLIYLNFEYQFCTFNAISIWTKNIQGIYYFNCISLRNKIDNPNPKIKL